MAMRVAMVAVTAMVLASVSATAPEAQAPRPEKPGWRLVWADEFDKDGLPDPAKWDYEEGFVRNNEAQFYTRGRKENARVEGGRLIIEGRKETWANPRYYPESRRGSSSRARAEYTSASLHTLGKASWKYGRIEVRAKLPQGKGVWPAIWMMGVDRPKVGWPACGEIDIMEFVGHTPDKMHATVHWRQEGKHRSKGSNLKVQRPFDDFHVYAMEWDEQKMEFFYDETKYFTFKLDDGADGQRNPFRQEHYLILNLALGGTWGREIDDAVLPQRYEIDYVRVYERAR